MPRRCGEPMAAGRMLHCPFNASIAGALVMSLDRASLPIPLHYLTERGLLKGNARGQWVS